MTLQSRPFLILNFFLALVDGFVITRRIRLFRQDRELIAASLVSDIISNDRIIADSDAVPDFQAG